MTRPVALVTGSSKGIGAAVARRFGAAGHHVVVTYLDDEAGGRRVAEGIAAAGGSVNLVRLDVRDEANVAEVFEAVESAHGHLDVLVNNAAKEDSAPLDRSTFEGWRATLSTKLDGAFLCTRAAAPLFARAPAPSMIAISTFEGDLPNPDYVAYGVASAGLNAFVKAMAVWLPTVGARANAVCPGPVPTAIWGEDEANEPMWRHLAQRNPVGRNATAEEVAEVVLLVATEPTRLLNGSFVAVTGGDHLVIPMIG